MYQFWTENVYEASCHTSKKLWWSKYLTIMIPSSHFLSQRKVEQIYFGMNPNQTEQYFRTIQCLYITAYLHSNRRSILIHNMALQKIPFIYLNTTRPNTLLNSDKYQSSCMNKETDWLAKSFWTEKRVGYKFCLVIIHSL